MDDLAHRSDTTGATIMIMPMTATLVMMVVVGVLMPVAHESTIAGNGHCSTSTTTQFARLRIGRDNQAPLRDLRPPPARRHGDPNGNINAGSLGRTLLG
jgi:hypothetical protein